MTSASSIEPRRESVFEKLRLMRECPLCSAEYAEKQVVVLEEGTGGHLVHMTCDECQNAILSLVTLSSVGMSSVGMMTDLSANDVRRLSSKSPISDNTLLAFHEYLKQDHVFEYTILQKIV